MERSSFVLLADYPPLGLKSGDVVEVDPASGESNVGRRLSRQDTIDLMANHRTRMRPLAPSTGTNPTPAKHLEIIP